MCGLVKNEKQTTTMGGRGSGGRRSIELMAPGLSRLPTSAFVTVTFDDKKRNSEGEVVRAQGFHEDICHTMMPGFTMILSSPY